MFELVIGAVWAFAIVEPTPYWVDTTVYEQPAECGACGAEVDHHMLVLDYADEELVEVCDECWLLALDDTEENRSAVKAEILAER